MYYFNSIIDFLLSIYDSNESIGFVSGFFIEVPDELRLFSIKKRFLEKKRIQSVCRLEYKFVSTTSRWMKTQSI
jgi:hypothetical protein